MNDLQYLLEIGVALLLAPTNEQISNILNAYFHSSASTTLRWAGFQLCITRENKSVEDLTSRGQEGQWNSNDKQFDKKYITFTWAEEIEFFF